MKKIYEEYLHVPEDGKIKEKVFIARIVVAIVCVVCCLSAMGFSAYAFFTSSITSGSNTIVAATYGVEATITTGTETVVTAKADNPLLYENVAAGTYAVSLKATGSATTGYCKIEIVGSEKTVTLFTQQLPPEAGMSFTLVLNGGANIAVTPQWGTYSNRDVVVGDGATQEILLVTEKDTSAGESDGSATNLDDSGTDTDKQQTETPTESAGEIQTEISIDTEENLTEDSTGNQTPEETQEDSGKETKDDGTE